MIPVIIAPDIFEPTLLRPGPNSLGICLMRVSEARKASYFLALPLTFFFATLLTLLRAVLVCSRGSSIDSSMSMIMSMSIISITILLTSSST